MKIVITEGAVLTTGDMSFDAFRKFGDLVVYDNMTYSELLKEIVDTDILLCNKISVDAAALKCAKVLKYVGTFATGYNNIDIDYCTKHGITVCNAGSYSSNAVAQQTFGYILNHYSKISDYDNFVKQGGWVKSPLFSPIAFDTDELADKTIGIIGFGSIGKKVAEIARAFDMNVIVHTRTVRDDGVTKFVSLDELLEKSDIVTVHIPLTEQSNKMFDSGLFKKFKNNSFFINTARGGLVDEDALLNALQSGKLSGAAVDVVAYEPMRADCPLLKAPNITITPHSAWLPYETRKRLFKIVENNISEFLKGTPINKVN